MIERLIAAVIVITVVCYWLLRGARATSGFWFVVVAWRLVSGEAHHGKPVTDAGWFRSGSRALTPTSHAHRWWHRPRWQRMAHRLGSLVALVVGLWGLLTYPQATGAALIAAAAAGAVYGGVRVTRRLRARKVTQQWLLPLHLRIHQIAGVPRATLASSWLQVRLDGDGAVEWARIEPPAGWPADPKDQDVLVARAASTLAIEAPEVKRTLHGPSPVIELARSQPPPRLVTLDEILPELDKCAADELVVGIGKHEAVVKVSLKSDSPHFGASMGTGGGKSNLAAWLLLQVLRQGGIALILDNKWISQPWLMNLPNVAFAYTPEQIHDAMIWCGTELDRRNQVAFRAVDYGGKVHANVGPPLWILAEELNLVMPQLKDFWSSSRDGSDPRTSPAITAFGSVAYAGRAADMHMLLIGQMLTAAATGSGKDSSVKENIGVKFMSRYSAKNWRNLNDDLPMPPVPTVLGRVQAVTAGGSREAQVPRVDLWRARELVLAGTVTPCPAGMPGRQVTDTPRAQLQTGPDQQPVTITTPPPVTPIPAAVTLKEAVDLGLLHPRTTLGALRMARHRDDSFPASLPEMRGTAQLFDPAALAMWDRERRS